MRWMFRFVILGLAGFGAYKLYELLQPKAAQVRDQASQAADTAQTIAGDVRDDLRDAGTATARTVADDVRDDLEQAGYTGGAAEDVDLRAAH
jgi:hypothetical protein